MKKFLIAILFLLFYSYLLVANDLYFNGANTAEYIYKSSKDSLKSFFSDEFNFRLTYKKLSYGMRFIANLPRYDTYNPADELSPYDLTYEWDERYIEYKDNFLLLRGGNFEESFGSGMILRAYRDKDFNIDTRLNGLLINYSPQNFTLKALYAGLPNQSMKSKHDVVGGIDLMKRIANSISLGATFAEFQILQADNTYYRRDILGTRIDFYNDWLDIYSEYAYLKQYNGISKDGKAFYANLNGYISKFSVSSAYTFYKDFSYRLHELPIVNHHQEPLYHEPLGEDQQGLMCEIKFIPDYSNEITINYAEEWNNDASVRLADLFLETVHNFENLYLKFSCEIIEQLDDNNMNWEKEITPAITLDFLWSDLPVSIKAEYQYYEKEVQENHQTHWEPLLQFGISYKDYDISLISEYSYKNMDDVWKNPLWLGAEIQKEIFNNSKLVMFFGKEKGGKVCRNGICKQRSQFEGLRLELRTTL